jgi:hypothetical protein
MRLAMMAVRAIRITAPTPANWHAAVMAFSAWIYSLLTRAMKPVMTVTPTTETAAPTPAK